MKSKGDLELEQEIASLENYEKEFKQQELYSEAEMVSEKIILLKEKLAIKNQRVVQLSQVTERKSFEKEFKDELEKFHKIWDKRINYYIENCELELNDFKETLRKQINIKKNELKSKQHALYKPSSYVLDLTKSKQSAAKIGDYAEAQHLLHQIDSSVALERDKFFKDNQSAMDKLLAEFEEICESRLKALENRHQKGLIKLEIQRSLDLELLTKRYQNLKSNLEAKHQKTKSIQEKKNKTFFSGLHRSSSSTFYTSIETPRKLF
jgi:hypothetical protein